MPPLKYTPGPWYCRRGMVSDFPIGGEQTGTGRIIAVVQGQPSAEEFVGNCKLIAAAPRLYELAMRLTGDLSNGEMSALQSEAALIQNELEDENG
jgi:hypothetical protein